MAFDINGATPGIHGFLQLISHIGGKPVSGDLEESVLQNREPEPAPAQAGVVLDDAILYRPGRELDRPSVLIQALPVHLLQNQGW